MQLSSIEISRFRSITSAHLAECGALNVLIGKNNSGKSNILSAIQVFYDFLKDQRFVASAKPPITTVTDWFNRETNEPVTLTVSLTLADDELSQIRTAISQEAPQMRNALEEVSSINTLECALTFYQDPFPIGFISHLTFGREEDTHRIFRLSKEVAVEIAEYERTYRELKANLQSIDRMRIDPDDWMTIRERGVERAYLSRTRFGPNVSGDLNSIIIGMMRTSDSYDDFRDRLSGYESEIRGRTSALLTAETKTKMETFSGESTVVPKYVSTIINLIAGLKVHHLYERRESIGPEEASRILRLKTSRGRGHVLKGIQDTVSELLGVGIDAFSSDRQPSRSSAMAAELDVDDFLVQVNGSGIREALRLILDYEFERPQILMVEEPEVHLHPALEIAMMQYLRKISSSCQVFLTTHSTNFLDIADLRNVYLVTRDNSTHIQLLDVEEAEEAIPQELGIRLSSLFMYDRLIFVEGPSDEQVLRVFASTLGLNLSRTGVGFVTTGGARNFTHYASAATLTFLAKRRVRLYFVLDRDERDLPEIEKLERQIVGLGQLKVLKRRELENYLLNPNALSRYLSQQTRNEVGEADVKQAIDEALDKLLETAVERRVLRVACKPLFPDREVVLARGDVDFVEALRVQLSEVEKHIVDLKDKIPSLLESVRAAIEGSSREEKLQSIPGDAILDVVFNKFGRHFSKRKDGPKIASIMWAREIPEEIASVLKEFVSSA